MPERNIVNVSKLRAKLDHYIEQLIQGEELTLIKHSVVLGELHLQLDPHFEKIIQARVPKVQYTYFVEDKPVKFRQYGEFENSDPLLQLNQETLKHAGLHGSGSADRGLDLLSIGPYFTYAKGEFWIGEQEDRIVAMGGFHAAIGLDWAPEGAALLKRLRVQPELQGKGIGSYLLNLLETRAKHHSYSAIMLDFSDTKQSSPRRLYEGHGYQQVGRQGNLLRYQKLL
jgi:GNAT superfamily N-acetyltransferase